MGMPSQSEVREALGVVEVQVMEILERCWRRYAEMLFSPYRVDSPRTRANILWDWFTGEAKLKLAAIPGVRVELQPNTVWYFVDEMFLLRFKKLTHDGFTSNYPTQAALAYHDQQEDLEGIPPVWRLDVGYILDQTETAIDDVRVVLRNGNRVEWQYSLFDEPSANVVSLTGSPSKPSPKTVFTIKGAMGANVEQNDAERGDKK